MTFKPNYDMYDLNIDNIKDLNNKLFCTFTSVDGLDILIEDISRSYTIMYNKMFVLFVKSTNEYVVTYNVDQGNINNIPENTILVHRKKESNTLYTINALNELIKKLNEGVVDINYRVNWQHYKNSILLTQHNELKQLNTKVFKIIEL
jgi:hypothetical protein